MQNVADGPNAALVFIMRSLGRCAWRSKVTYVVQISLVIRDQPSKSNIVVAIFVGPQEGDRLSRLRRPLTIDYKNIIAVVNSVGLFNVELWIDDPNVTGADGHDASYFFLVADPSH